MTAALHVSTPALTARASPRRWPFRLSLGLATVGAVAAVMAVTLYADLPWTATATPQPLSADRAPAFAHEVDWSRIEAAPDPGPMAVAAYERWQPLPLEPLSAERALAFALEVDWSRIEAAPDPGPMAVAAYGP